MSAHQESGRRRDRGAGQLAGLVARYGLPEPPRPNLQALQAALTDDPHAPTTIRGPLSVVRDHLADSLVALELPAVQGGHPDRRPGIRRGVARPAARHCPSRRHP